MELGNDVIGRDGDIIYVVVDYWIPMDGYEARSVKGIDGDGDQVAYNTQLRKVGESEWFRAL